MPPVHVLVIGYVWPEPASSAASGHIMQLLHSFLAQGWTITFASPAGPGEHKADLAALGIAEQPIELNNASFDHFITRLQPDIVLFERFMMEEQFGWRVEQHCPNAIRVLETSDLQSLRDARQELLKARLKQGDTEDDFGELFHTPPHRLFEHMSGTDITQREVASIYRCDLSLIISPFEAQLLTDCFAVPAALLHDCPLMVDLPVAEPLPLAQRSHFMCIGNFRHAPNWDAVLWLKQQLWPLIRARLPRAQLHVYGAYTPPKATALHNPAQGFHIRGWAPDALQVIGQARVALAPLRFGAGIKGKLLDAMICGTPSVTTPVGAEGMRCDGQWPGAVAISASALAEAAVALHEDDALWHAAQARAQDCLSAGFAFQVHARTLAQRLAALRENLSAHRANNFTGAMLRHHQHKSTRYLAQWIEAKSKLV
ncbi:glycosyltransferase [Pseudomonas sp. UBA4194]|uniref:glycosyltransferase n=1 Tax=Pseudomonas sp. UBA4194 TaxID=1947317 RepID=UPI0025CD1552|nr:glycosyltransferase [Pseudomonas sp. UBA4194]